MSDFTVGRLEHYKMLMEPTPPFLDALIAEKQKHDDLQQEIGSLIGKLETRAEKAHSKRFHTSASALRHTARDLTRILEGDNG